MVFDAPTKDWASRRNVPTIDVYLYDIREDLRRRERGLINEYDARDRITHRHLPPRHFKLSYLVTAWTQRPEDEHRLLAALLSCFLRHDAIPTDLVTGPLAEIGLPVPMTVALPPPEDRSFADVWSALGGELKPSLDVVVSAPTDTGQRYEAGPPVVKPGRISIGGVNGSWPPTEEREQMNGAAAALRSASATGGSGDSVGPGCGGRWASRSEGRRPGRRRFDLAGVRLQRQNSPALIRDPPQDRPPVRPLSMRTTAARPAMATTSRPRGPGRAPTNPSRRHVGAARAGSASSERHQSRLSAASSRPCRGSDPRSGVAPPRRRSGPRRSVPRVVPDRGGRRPAARRRRPNRPGRTGRPGRRSRRKPTRRSPRARRSGCAPWHPRPD